MRALCLGGAGRISRESVWDLVEFSDFERVTVADTNEAAGREVVQWLHDPRVDFTPLDVHNHTATVEVMRAYDLVMDGTTIAMNGLSTACIAEAGVHGINLNGFGAEKAFDPLFKTKGKICVAGFGMTPGLTNLMTMHAAHQLDTVEVVRISHGAFRPIAFSAGIAETTRLEYDPALPSRLVYEDGQFKQVPPFARPREIELPEPYGTHPQYIIPHAETVTLASSLKEKGVRLIEVRGTWPPKNMQLLRALYDWGVLRNDKVRIGTTEIGVFDAIEQYLLTSREGRETELYGYALHVEVLGTKAGKGFQHVLTHTHPSSDGSVEGWEKLRAYTRNVGIPMSIGAQLIARGRAHGTGVVHPELAFAPLEVFQELERRGILVHQKVTELCNGREKL